jgi:prefoldin subunit 5
MSMGMGPSRRYRTCVTRRAELKTQCTNWINSVDSAIRGLTTRLSNLESLPSQFQQTKDTLASLETATRQFHTEANEMTKK